MPLDDSLDPNKDFINAMTYLGKGPFNIGMPGGSDLSVGAGPAPAPGVNVGTFGQRFGGGPAQSGAVGAGGSGGGSDILGMLQNFLKAGGKTSDFLSKLKGTPTTEGGDVLQDMAGMGQLGLGADTTLSGLGTELPNTTLGSTPDMAGLLEELRGTLGSSSLSDPTLGLNLGGGLGAGSSAGSLGGSLGAGASGAGVLGALLGAIGSATGSEDLAKAGSALGAAGTGAGLAATGANLAATGGTLAAEGAGAGGAAAGAAGAGAGAGIGAGAGAALAPVAAALLIDSIMQLAGDKDAPNLIGSMMEGTMGAYPFFGQKLTGTLGVENTDLNALANALPYAGSQQELQGLLDLYKQGVGQNVGGYGEGSDPFSVPNLPGAGGSKHEGGLNADFGPQVNLLNQLIGNMKGGLPETGGGDAAQLWNQFHTQAVSPQSAPMQVTMPDGNVKYLTPAEYWSLYGANPDSGISAIGYGEPGYNYQGAGLIAPGNVPGAPTDAFTKALAMMRGGQGAAPTTVAPNAPGTAPNDVYYDLLKQLGATG